MYKDIIGIVICGLVVLILIMLGFVLRSGKGASLIAGYNMLPEEKKALYNEKKLCRFTGNLLFMIAFWTIIALIGGIYELLWLVKLTVVLILITAIACIIYVNTSPRIRNKTK